MGGDEGMGNGNFHNSSKNPFSYSSNIDAEELFRKIFNQSGFGNSGNFEEDFADSKFGFGAAEEVMINLKYIYFNCRFILKIILFRLSLKLHSNKLLEVLIKI